jgi:hypothetical protein
MRAALTMRDITSSLNVGDQLSDLNGNTQGERFANLPNPFYYIP